MQRFHGAEAEDGSNVQNRLLAVRALLATLKVEKFDESDIVDDDEKVAAVLGAKRHLSLVDQASELDEDDAQSGRGSTASRQLNQIAEQHLQAYEQELIGRLADRVDPLDRNLKRLSRVVGLNDTECRLLDFVLRRDADPLLGEIADSAQVPNGHSLVRVLARILECKRAHVRTALSEESRLAQSGILNVDEQGPRLRSHHAQHACDLTDIRSLPGLTETLSASRFDFDRIFAPFFQSVSASDRVLSDYDHLADDVAVLRAMMSGALREDTAGVHVLLYGPPGTGKTELARALCEAVDANAYAVASGSVLGNAYDRDERFRCFRLAQQALQARGRTVLLFDEIEDVFSSFGGLMTGEKRQKGWINNLIETAPVPTIWLTNDPDALDPAYVRRFTMSLSIDRPPRHIRQRIAEHYIGEYDITHDRLRRVANAEVLTPADLERAKGALHLVHASGDESVTADSALVSVLGSGPAGPGKSALQSRQTVRLPDFDPALINTDIDLDQLVAGVTRSGAARVCLDGMPGTGKTAFAQHLAEKLDRELHTVSASDWLNPFVGVTEQKIRAAFEEAERAGAVLLVDEADSFLQDRTRAGHRWETTQVNELLKRLEECAGIALFATNAPDALDRAVLRRFDVKATFRPLNRHQTRSMLERSLAAQGREADEASIEQATQHIRAAGDNVHGDYNAALNKLRITGQPATMEALADALVAEIESRSDDRERRVGFLASLE